MHCTGLEPNFAQVSYHHRTSAVQLRERNDRRGNPSAVGAKQSGSCKSWHGAWLSGPRMHVVRDASDFAPLKVRGDIITSLRFSTQEAHYQIELWLNRDHCRLEDGAMLERHVLQTQRHGTYETSSHGKKHHPGARGFAGTAFLKHIGGTLSWRQGSDSCKAWDSDSCKAWDSLLAQLHSWAVW